MCHVWAMISTYVVNCLKLVVQLCRQDFVICLCVLIDISILEIVYVPDSMWCELFVPNSIWESNFTFSLRSGFCFPPLKMAKSSILFYVPISSSVIVVLSWMRSSTFRLECIRWPSLSVRPSVLLGFIFLS